MHWYLHRVEQKYCSYFVPFFLCASILVSDFLPQATTQSLYFGWSLTGGSTVIDNLDSGKKLLVWNYVWKSLEFWTQKSVELLFMYRELYGN